MKLTAKVIEAARPRDKSYKMYDGAGLHLEVRPSGAKYWRQDYCAEGKQKRLSLGVFPIVSLKEARLSSYEIRAAVANGDDPLRIRASEKQAAQLAQAEAAAEKPYLLSELLHDWVAWKRQTWSAPYTRRVEERIRSSVLRYIGAAPAETVTRSDLSGLLEQIVRSGRVDTAYRVADYLRAAYEWAEDAENVSVNPARRLRKLLPQKRVQNRAHFQSPRVLGEFLRACDGYHGSPVTIAAMKLSALVFLRPGEIRQAYWSEIDWSEALWRKPKESMKSRRPHLVPLSTQALDLLKELHRLTGAGPRMFPGQNEPSRALSENTVRVAMRRMGFTNDQITPHGLRGTASTLLHEQGWPTNVVEAQLAHLDPDRTRAAYNHAEFLAQRRQMMQCWADYLDDLKKNRG